MKSATIKSVLPALALAIVAGCKTSEPPVGDPCTFEFPFMGDYGVVNRVVFNWHDSYVTNSSYAFHPEIAGPMAALAASTYGYRMGTDARSLLDLGFRYESLKRCYGADLSYKHPQYGRDRVGYTIASRHCELPGANYDIVVVMCRGTFGREEWLSNVNVCNEWGKDPSLAEENIPKHHEGFSKAAEDVMEALAEYVKEHGINLAKAKILVTGHSRGASVANLIGCRLDDAAESTTPNPFSAVNRDNVFVYTIACPNVTIRNTPETADPRYGNIYNVISPEDIVPLLPLRTWHGARYGHTLILRSFNYLPFTGSWTNTGYCDMKDNFRDICGCDYYHMLLGTNITARVPDVVTRVCPTIADYYWVHPDLREDGNLTSTHSSIEMILCRVLQSASTQERNISLSGDIETLASTYESIADESDISVGQKKTDCLKYQPGFTDIGWKFTCMHATQTYVSWLKSGLDNGPEEIFVNWEEECGGRKAE